MAPVRSDLYGRIWETVRRIPKGKVATYGGIAEMCGFPRHARLVGYALHNLPLGSNIPWHRVVNSQGRISLSKWSGGYQKQKLLLEKEGVVFVRERINLSTFGWSKWRTLTK
ncbi:MAG TPA: methyltransferase [Bacteroidetes bacterium]|nr:methyltransferase [Bacteroidota bacterium]